MRLKNGIRTSLNWEELDVILYALDYLKEYSTEDSDYPFSQIAEVYNKLEDEAKIK
jgi:hypothetical protein